MSDIAYACCRWLACRTSWPCSAPNARRTRRSDAIATRGRSCREAWCFAHRFTAPVKSHRTSAATSALSCDGIRGESHRRSPPGECQLIEYDSWCSPDRSRTGVTETTPPSCWTRWDWRRRALMRIPVAALEGEAVRSPQLRAGRAPPTSWPFQDRGR